MKESLLEVQNVSAGYGAKTVLHNISFAVDRGDFLSIIAPNGTGKSTLLRCIAGVLPVQTGNILVKGESVSSFPRRDLAKIIAVVGAEEAVFDYSVYQTALMGRFAHISRFGSETAADFRIVEKALQDVGMWEKRDAKMSKLSQGERQKALIARALAQCPEILLLDEPTSHLDLYNQFVILRLIKQLTAKNNIAVVAVIHDVNLAARFSTNLLLLKNGRMLACGPPAAVLSTEVLATMYDMEFVLHNTDGHIYVQPNFT